MTYADQVPRALAEKAITEHQRWGQFHPVADEQPVTEVQPVVQAYKVRYRTGC